MFGLAALCLYVSSVQAGPVGKKIVAEPERCLLVESRLKRSDRPILLWTFSPLRGLGADLSLEPFEKESFDRSSYEGTALFARCDTPGELAQTLDDLYAKNYRVGTLLLGGHGNCGEMHAMADWSIWQFEGKSRVFAPGAVIQFEGCGICEGEAGPVFLREVAKTLLAKGGYVYAPRGDLYPIYQDPRVRKRPYLDAPAGYCKLKVEAGGLMRLYYPEPLEKRGSDLLSECRRVREDLRRYKPLLSDPKPEHAEAQRWAARLFQLLRRVESEALDSSKLLTSDRVASAESLMAEAREADKAFKAAAK
ncbi:MAG: hypothetical protein HY921_13300 [Elusimicrobia bacterium]|nr:hypothetical protein [Elusimicrobiota bacterium]